MAPFFFFRLRLFPRVLVIVLRVVVTLTFVACVEPLCKLRDGKATPPPAVPPPPGPAPPALATACVTCSPGYVGSVSVRLVCREEVMQRGRDHSCTKPRNFP